MDESINTATGEPAIVKVFITDQAGTPISEPYDLQNGQNGSDAKPCTTTEPNSS